MIKTSQTRRKGSLARNFPPLPFYPTDTERVTSCPTVVITCALCPVSSRLQHLSTNPPDSSQRGSVLCGLCVGDALSVAEGLRRTPACAIEHAVSVPGAIGARAVDLQRQPIVELTCHRPSSCGDTNKHTISVQSDAEPPASGRFVVAVVLGDETAGIPQRDGAQLQHIRRKTPSNHQKNRPCTTASGSPASSSSRYCSHSEPSRRPRAISTCSW